MVAQKHVIIVGMGPAGHNLCRALASDRNIKVTVLERKDHLDFCVGTPRAAVNKAFADESCLMHNTTLPQGINLIKVKEVTQVAKGGLITYTTFEGQTVSVQGDAVVVATGSRYNGSFMKNNNGVDKAAWLQVMDKFKTTVAASQHVVCIGGGATGVELAAEIANDFGIKVTLVHRSDELLMGGPKLHKVTMDAVKRLPSIEVVLNDAIDHAEYMNEQGAKDITLKSGKVLKAVNMVVLCAGTTPNSKFIDPALLDPRGFIEADERLVATSLTTNQCTVFAIGDVSNRGRGRIIYAIDHAAAVAKNIKLLGAGKPLQIVWATKKDTESLPCLISVGRKDGALSLPFPNNMLGKALKVKDMAVPYIMNKCGIKAKLSQAAMTVDPSCKK